MTYSMASGSYARRAHQMTLRQQRAPMAATRGSRVLAIAHRSFWLDPWVLYPIGAACLLMVIVSTGILNPRPITPSYISTSRGRSYAIQVGGDQARSGQKDQAITIPTPTAVPPQATPAPLPNALAYSVVASPSIQAGFINQVLSTYKSPAGGRGQTLHDLGVQYGIDPIYALAFFMHESSFGTKG